LLGGGGKDGGANEKAIKQVMRMVLKDYRVNPSTSTDRMIKGIRLASSLARLRSRRS
jgi:hypothetical protein